MVIDAAKRHRGADAQAVRGLPAAQRADHHLRQQGRPRGPRAVRAARRDRRHARARRRADELAGRHGRRRSRASTISSPTALHLPARHDGGAFRGREPSQFTGLDDPKLADAALGRGPRQAARGGRAGAGRLSRIRRRRLSPRRPDPGLFRLGAEGFRRRRADRRARRASRRRRVPQPAEPAPVDPDDAAVTGFIFKVQANMDPQHRDRVAFMRLVLGHASGAA